MREVLAAIGEELVKLVPGEHGKLRRDVGISYSDLADLQMRFGDKVEARVYSEKSLAVAEQLVMMLPWEHGVPETMSASAIVGWGNCRCSWATPRGHRGITQSSWSVAEELVKLDPANTLFRDCRRQLRAAG